MTNKVFNMLSRVTSSGLFGKHKLIVSVTCKRELSKKKVKVESYENMEFPI